MGVIIGRDGTTKCKIETKSSTRLSIDSESGSVCIYGDPLKTMRTADVIKAIGNGFSSERALTLLDDELLMLDIVDLSRVASTPKELKRLKGRLIGKNGKARNLMESLTSTKISVYGKTVSIIGRSEQIEIIRAAINMLINGSPHARVYKFLEKKKGSLGGLVA